MNIWFDHSLTRTLSAYAPVFIFIVMGVGIGCALLVLAWLRGVRKPDADKLSTYECGFDPIGDVSAKFDVRFYVVSVLFILFDVEVIFLFPWAASFHDMSFWGYGSMMVFLAILIVGFVYEWQKGALEWE